MPLIETGSLAYCVMFVTLIACAAGQVVHGYLRIIHSTDQTRTLSRVYESALLVHIMLMAAYALECTSGTDAFLSFLYAGIPLQPALWVNVPIAVVAAYTALAGVEDVDMPVGVEDPGWTPAVDSILILLVTPPIQWALGDTWPIALCIDAAYFLYRTCFLLLVDKRLRHQMVSPLSIAEAMKLLPEGILYADRFGRTLVANDAIRHCLSALGLSTDFGQVEDLWRFLHEQAEGPHAVPLAESVERQTGDWVILRIGPDEVRLFSFEGLGFEQDKSYPSARPLDSVTSAPAESRRLLGAEARMRVLALDVTAEVKTLQEIDRANAQLAASQRELQESLSTVQEAAENEAMLRMRARVHDVIGQRLSMLHRALEDDDLSDEKLDQLKPLLNGILDDLGTDSHIEPADELAATVNAFAVTGVSVQVEGKLPDDELTAKLFVDCIREGATNAVKHSHATEIYAVCEPDCLTITNDGTPHEGPVVEGTGLGHMRQIVSAAGGTLSVEADPFALRVAL